MEALYTLSALLSEGGALDMEKRMVSSFGSWVGVYFRAFPTAILLLRLLALFAGEY